MLALLFYGFINVNTTFFMNSLMLTMFFLQIYYGNNIFKKYIILNKLVTNISNIFFMNLLMATILFLKNKIFLMNCF